LQTLARGHKFIYGNLVSKCKAKMGLLKNSAGGSFLNGLFSSCTPSLLFSFFSFYRILLHCQGFHPTHNPSTSISLTAGITGVYHCAWLAEYS
jgi:hypothetical protein